MAEIASAARLPCSKPRICEIASWRDCSRLAAPQRSLAGETAYRNGAGPDAAGVEHCLDGAPQLMIGAAVRGQKRAAFPSRLLKRKLLQPLNLLATLWGYNSVYTRIERTPFSAASDETRVGTGWAYAVLDSSSPQSAEIIIFAPPIGRRAPMSCGIRRRARVILVKRTSVTCKKCKVAMKELKGHIYHKQRKWQCPRCKRVKMQAPKPVSLPLRA